MTEPSSSRPVPGPARPVPGADGSGPASSSPATSSPASSSPARAAQGERFAALAALADRPVAEHVEVFEAEHDRLQAELGTIDRI